MCFQPVHHSLRLVPAKCFTPEEQGMFVFFDVTNAAAPSERTARDFFFLCMQNFSVLLQACTCSCTFEIHISKYK